MMDVQAAAGYQVSLDGLAPYLDGAYLLVNAVPDAVLVYDAHDCGYYKAEKLAASHDLFSTLLGQQGGQRILRTNQEMADYIMGSESKLSRKILQAARRPDVEFILVARSSVVTATGSDTAAVLRDCRRQIRPRLAALSEDRSDGDFVSGYLAAQAALLEQLPFPRRSSRSRRPAVLLVGYPYFRNEGDCTADVDELGRLVSSLDIHLCGLACDGGGFARMRRWRRPDLVVDLAGAWERARLLAERLGADYLSLGLPLGLRGTADWLRRLATACGSVPRAEQFIAAETSRLAARLRWLLPRFFAGRRAALVADRLWLQPLGRALEELGMLIAGCACSCAGDARLEPGWPRLPLSIPELRRALSHGDDGWAFDLVLGNSVVGQLLRDCGIPFVEIGYPAAFHHALRPEPLLGFAGFEALAQRMMNALLERQRAGLYRERHP